jgi:nucleotidyltransferase/DNA polymerase involved in DNA repair
MMAGSESLETIPGIGRELSKKFILIGIRKVSDLKNRDPEKLYKKLERTTGAHIDRCVLYTFRCAVYYASHRKHDPDLLKWWNWKDR